MNKLQKGITLYEAKKYQEAIDILEGLEYKEIRASLVMGLSYVELGNFKKGLHILEQGWYQFNENSAFIDNIIYMANKYFHNYPENDKPYSLEHFLRSYIGFSGNTYKRASIYSLLGLFADKEAFNEERTLEYFEKAVELEPKNEVFQHNLKYIKQKMENSILGEKFIIDPKIIAILDRLKKPCQVITKEMHKEIETDDEDVYHVFSINNNDKIKLPKEIKRLEVYFNDMDYVASYKLLDDYGIDEAENMLVENSYNLPDLTTIEGIYPEDYKILKAYFLRLNPEGDYYESAAYAQLVKKYLGHGLYPKFIGGNINQMYVDLYDYEDLNFLMQYQTDWGNGEIVFVFNTKENPLDLKIMVQH